MLKRNLIIAVVAIGTMPYVLPVQAQYGDGSPVAGVWSATSVVYTGPDTSWTNASPQPEVLIFNDRHWTSARIGGREPRALLPENPTDDQRLEAFRRLRMSAGWYEVEGAEMTTRTISHWNPNTQARRPKNKSEFKVDGDRMVRTFMNTAGDRKWVVTYERRKEAPATEIDGTWRIREAHFSSPDTSWAHGTDAPGFLTLRGGYYAVSRVSGSEPRDLWPEGGPSDDQRLASARRLRGSAGTFTVSDGELTITPIVHRNPNRMAEPRPFTAPYTIDGDVMWRTFKNEETGREFRWKYERVGS